MQLEQRILIISFKRTLMKTGKVMTNGQTSRTITEWKKVDESMKMKWKLVQTKATKAALFEMFTNQGSC